MKMKADHHRYIAEVTTGDVKAVAVSSAAAASAAAAELAVNGLAVAHPIRLGLALKYSTFLYEVQSKPQEACKRARTAFDAAIAELDNVRGDLLKDSTLIMQLLRDTLALWESEAQQFPVGADAVEDTKRRRLGEHAASMEL